MPITTNYILNEYARQETGMNFEPNVSKLLYNNPDLLMDLVTRARDKQKIEDNNRIPEPKLRILENIYHGRSCLKRQTKKLHEYIDEHMNDTKLTNQIVRNL